MSAPVCPIPGQRFELITSWLAVKHSAETNDALYYMAPLDRFPVRVIPRRVFKNGKIRLSVFVGCAFTADSGHLGRFWRLASEQP